MDLIAVQSVHRMGGDVIGHGLPEQIRAHA